MSISAAIDAANKRLALALDALAAAIERRGEADRQSAGLSFSCTPWAAIVRGSQASSMPPSPARMPWTT